jgi:transcriptional regulator
LHYLFLVEGCEQLLENLVQDITRSEHGDARSKMQFIIKITLKNVAIIGGQTMTNIEKTYHNYGALL